MAVVHARDIVHRDLKPDNIFLCAQEDGSVLVKLLDFGICKVAPEPGGPSLTQTSTIFGTPYYMSPEHARVTKSVDHRTDIWSVGVIMYEALTGHVPYEGDHYNIVIAALLTEDYRRPSELCPEISSALEALLLKAMARNLDERYDNTEMFLADVLALEMMGPSPCRAESPYPGEIPRETFPAHLLRGDSDVALGTNDHSENRSSLSSVHSAADPNANTFRAIEREKKSSPRRKQFVLSIILALAVISALGGGTFVGLIAGAASSNTVVSTAASSVPAFASISPASRPVEAPSSAANVLDEMDEVDEMDEMDEVDEVDERDPSPPSEPVDSPDHLASLSSGHTAEARPSPAQALSKREVVSKLRSATGRIASCARRAGTKAAKIVVLLRIDGNGNTKFLRSSPSIPGSASACIQGIVSQLRYRKTGSSPRRIRYPVTIRTLKANPLR